MSVALDLPGAPARATSRAVLLGWLLFAALAVRLVVLLVTDPHVANDTVGFRGPTFVPLSYRDLAMSLLHWDFSADLGTRSPGYPALMAASFRLFGVDNWEAIVGLQTLMVLVLFFASYGLWSQLYPRGFAAVLATAAAVFEPVLILCETGVLSETLSVTLLMLSLPLAVHAALRRNPWTAAAAGLCLAWLALTRPAFAFLVPLFAFYLLARRGGFAALALFCVAALAPVLAWNGFNYARFGYFTPMTTQGFILTSHSEALMQREPASYGEYADVVEIMQRHRRPPNGMAIWLAYPEIMRARGLSFAEASRLMERFSLELFREQPVAFAKSVSRAFRDFWEARVVAPEEWSERLAFTLASKVYAALSAIALALFFAVIAIDLARWRRWREPGVLERLLILAIVLLVCAASTVPIAVENARYKVPLLPLMWGVLAASLATNWPRIRALLSGWR